MPLHAHQRRVFNDPARFKFVLTGRRGGKTKLVVEDMLRSIHTAPHGGEIFYIGPTNQQAYELIWEELDSRLSQTNWEYTPMPSKRRFEFTRYRKVYVIGAEKIRRIRGHKVWRAYLDELAFFGKSLTEVWRAVRPALSDLKGGAMVTTTPVGIGSAAYDFYVNVKTKDDWKEFFWMTRDNPFISKSEIEAAKKELDEKSFRQEYEAAWESFDGIAYYSFDAQIHIKPCKDIDLVYPIDITMDFNVDPTTLLVCQFDGKVARFKKEYSLKPGSTPETVKMFCEDHKHLKDTALVRIFGDASGNSRRSNTGMSDYWYVIDVLKQYGFKHEYCVLRANPPIVDRVMHMNAWLKNVNGESRVEVDPGCVDLIRDFTSQEVIGRIPTNKNNLGHKADSGSYYINWLQTSSSRKPQGTVRL